LNRKRIVPHLSSVSREKREALNGHKAAVVWFTGLPSSGKSTTAHAVEEQLFHAGCQAYVLDGDNVRHGLSSDLGFSAPDRKEHLRRMAELAKLVYDAGAIVLCAFISPTRASRVAARGLLPEGAFFEVYTRCPVEVCEQRDPKGHYAKARAGKISGYTGVSAPYEEPLAPELVLDTESRSVEACAARVIRLLRERGIIPRARSARAASQNRVRA
jgi:adenylylsulfate kinase